MTVKMPMRGIILLMHGLNSGTIGKVTMQEQTIKNLLINDPEEIRAEELIMSIYKNKIEKQNKGIKVVRVIMSMDSFKKIKLYHLSLGEIQGELGDYITDDEIFGIPVYIDHVNGIIVE